MNNKAFIQLLVDYNPLIEIFMTFFKSIVQCLSLWEHYFHNKNPFLICEAKNGILHY